MFKQGIIYLLLSIVVVLLAKYANLLIIYIDLIYTHINIILVPIFSSSELGILIRKIITLVMIPVLIAAIPALVYYAIKRRQMPYFIQITWILWLVIALSKVLIH